MNKTTLPGTIGLIQPEDKASRTQKSLAALLRENQINEKVKAELSTVSNLMQHRKTTLDFKSNDTRSQTQLRRAPEGALATINFAFRNMSIDRPLPTDHFLSTTQTSTGADSSK